jgi:hypothetical protein
MEAIHVFELVLRNAIDRELRLSGTTGWPGRRTGCCAPIRTYFGQ